MLQYFKLFILLFIVFMTMKIDEAGCFFNASKSCKNSLKTFVFWPNATVPFYINPDHFDDELQTAILKSLDSFVVNTCIRFIPVIGAPSEDQHVMTFINPEGVRRCKIEMKGHTNYNSHAIVVGYECINTPKLDMIIMRALGLPFEHNRMSRHLYIDVLIENVEPSYIQLFTKDSILPEALRKIPYDANSIMHFGERDYSKNGHRTIRFKRDVHRLDRKGLTDSDRKKIALIYGPECVTRDRAVKVALCRTRYISRRKREINIEPTANISLRVNSNITPPPHIIRTQRRIGHKSGKLPTTVQLNKLTKEFYNERKWPDGVVIYVVANLPDYDLEDVRNRLAAVNSILMEKTCVKLREVDAKEAPGFDDYMILDTSPDYVTGRVGGKQNFGSLELFEGGHHKQHTAMVVMAMLGFYFEVSRHDRDKHIRVHNRHIRADKLHHFEKIRDEATLDLPYDYKSATHPAWQFWRRIGKKGISTVATFKEQDPDGSVMRALGQNPELLSETDIIKINSVYGVECFQSNHASNKKESVRMLEEKDDVIQ